MFYVCKKENPLKKLFSSLWSSMSQLFRSALKQAITEAHIIAYVTDTSHTHIATRELDFELLMKAEAWFGQRKPDFEIELEKFKLHSSCSDDDKLYSAKMFSER